MDEIIKNNLLAIVINCVLLGISYGVLRTKVIRNAADIKECSQEVKESKRMDTQILERLASIEAQLQSLKEIIQDLKKK